MDPNDPQVEEQLKKAVSHLLYLVKTGKGLQEGSTRESLTTQQYAKRVLGGTRNKSTSTRSRTTTQGDGLCSIM